MIAKELCQLYGFSPSFEEISADTYANKAENSANSSANNFVIEFSDFLREYGFPYMNVIEAPVNERFSDADHRILTLKFLCTELLVARNCPQQKEESSESGANGDLAEYLKKACLTLNVPISPHDTDIAKLFSILIESITKAISNAPPDYLGKPMLPLGGLSEKQWSDVCRIGQILDDEYTNRRETLIKRADCTVQSFKWSDRAKSRLEEIEAAYGPLRAAMRASPWGDVIPHLLAARNVQLLRLEKTSGLLAREFTSCPLNRILITGQVPDRGGRTWEIEAPPPEMPAFQKRQSGGGGRASGRGRGERGIRGNSARGGGGRGGFSSGNVLNGGRGRGGFSSYGMRPQSGISFERQDDQNSIQHEVVFQPQFFRGHVGRGRGRKTRG